jgi:putative CocE/NonD family hydrolase
MMSPIRTLGLVLACCFGVPLALAQQPSDFAGCWEGHLDKLGLFVRLELSLGEAGLAGTIDIPDQQAEDLPLEVVSQQGAAIELRIQGVPGKPTFTGTLDPEARRLAGEFTQSGARFGFVLEPCRNAAEATAPETAPAPPFELDEKAQTAELLFTLMGGAAGSVRIESDAAGACRSTSSLKIPGQATESVLEAHRDPATGRWTDFRLVVKAGSQRQEAIWDGRAVLQPGRSSHLAWSGGGVFSALHPVLMDSLFELTAPGEHTILLLDNLMLEQAELLPIKARLVAGESLPGRRLEIGGLAIDVWRGAAGVVGFEVPAQAFRSAAAELADELFVDPIKAFPELSQATFKTTQDTRLAVRMRDGVELAATLTRPKPEGRYPAILLRTPYGRELSALEGAWWAARGYAHVAQDVRGRGDSGGDWDPFQNERQDGFDTIEWLAAQPWCDGRVGMIGASYLGFVQWQAAVEKPEALRCIIPQVSPPHPCLNIPWDHGLFLLGGNVWWARIVQGKATDFSSLGEVPGGPALATLPLSKADDAVFGASVPFFDAWLERDHLAAWTAATLDEVAAIEIPTLLVSGTWDGDGIGTKLQWEARRRAGHANQWLVFGPWDHAFNTKSKFGHYDYGDGALLELDPLYLRFFDTFLKEKEVKLEGEPRVRLFQSGANRWLELADFPDPSWQRQEWFLGAPTPANGRTSGGVLRPAPEPDEPTRWLYNPARAAIDLEDLDTDTEAAETQLEIEEPEQGVLLFRGPAFEAPTLVSGSLEVDLFVATSARDGLLTAMIADQGPDGELSLLGLPGNRRFGWTGSEIRPVEPGRPFPLRLEPWWFCHRFEAGHRLVLVLTSEAFPNFARVLGTGEPDKHATRLIAAHQTLFHDPQHPSRLIFWSQTQGGDAE